MTEDTTNTDLLAEPTSDADTIEQEDNSIPAEDAPTEGKNEEAKRYRLRLRDTEGALEATRNALKEQADAYAQLIAQREGYNREILRVLDHTAWVNEAGTIDENKLVESFHEAATITGASRAPRRPAPVPEAGMVSASHIGLSWGDALNHR